LVFSNSGYDLFRSLGGIKMSKKRNDLSLSVLPEYNNEIEETVDEALKRESEWRIPLDNLENTKNEKLILRFMEKYKKALLPIEISKALRLHISTVRYVLNVLERNGFVKKKYGRVTRITKSKRRMRARCVLYCLK
jgi:DNA-binding MarR family transcriptional regulator